MNMKATNEVNLRSTAGMNQATKCGLSLVVTVTVICLALFLQPNSVLAQTSEKPLTESQQILKKIVEDIRHCDKTVRYEYDSKTRSVNPPELAKIKGFRLKKLYREIAVFEIDERYEGLRATVLTTGRSTARYLLPIHSVAFRSDYKTVRERLEGLWSLRFQDGLRPGPDVIEDGLYAETTMIVDGKERTLSVERMPPEVYPHVTLPRVGCNHVDI